MGTSFSEILIYGAGGHGKVVADILERREGYKVAGFLDDNPELWGRDLMGYRVLGGISVLIEEEPSRYSVIIAIGDNRTRERLVARLNGYGCRFARAIHPSAQIARDTQIGSGAMVMANVAINPDARIGAHAIINTGATVDHDCVIHDFVHISPGAVLAGNVLVHEGAHLGMACSILPNVEIGAYAVIGAGAVVTKDIPARVTAVGIPARPIGVSEL